MSDEQTVTVSYDDLFSLVIMQTIIIEKLRKALKPFADAAERNLGPDDARIVGDCTLGDLRAAAAALRDIDNDPVIVPDQS